MPKTIIVHTLYDNDPYRILKELISKKLIQTTSVNGVKVYGRYYHNKSKLRDAYHKFENKLYKRTIANEKRKIIKSQKMSHKKDGISYPYWNIEVPPDS